MIPLSSLRFRATVSGSRALGEKCFTYSGPVAVLDSVLGAKNRPLQSGAGRPLHLLLPPPPG